MSNVCPMHLRLKGLSLAISQELFPSPPSKLILTSAAASDVTSIRFTARKANTAAASTGKECTLFQLLAYPSAWHTACDAHTPPGELRTRALHDCTRTFCTKASWGLEVVSRGRSVWWLDRSKPTVLGKRKIQWS